jgi:hypothetical protein
MPKDENKSYIDRNNLDISVYYIPFLFFNVMIRKKSLLGKLRRK